ncbi:hypothetical protein [Dyadobacter sp.]|uniref:hypothetical protein n=1 Tax=Dyadobacter sp. TaxID=1914288 RepID=UPI003F6F89CA
MKTTILIVILGVLLLGCFDKIDLAIDTLYLKDGDRATQRSQAVSKLYEHYAASEKNREAYEVVSKKSGRFILNFTPGLGLLTVCGDPGSGWSQQFQNVDEAMLKKLVDEGISFDDLYDVGSMSHKVDSLLVRKRPIYNVNTNGNPK